MITQETMIKSDKKYMLHLVEQLVDGGIYYKHEGFVPLEDSVKQSHISVLKEYFGFSDKSIELLSK